MIQKQATDGQWEKTRDKRLKTKDKGEKQKGSTGENPKKGPPKKTKTQRKANKNIFLEKKQGPKKRES